MAVARPGEGFFSFLHFGHRSTVTSICSNSTIAQSYLSQILSLIQTLQANTTTNATLQQRYSSFVSYLQNSTNQAVLTSNCTTFVSNLKVAQAADKNRECVAQELEDRIQQQFQQVARNATGSRKPVDVDDSQGDNFSFL